MNPSNPVDVDTIIADQVMRLRRSIADIKFNMARVVPGSPQAQRLSELIAILEGCVARLLK